ncbi:MAG: hypothetical protein JSW10_04845 [Pseudomonadota bacterium]|nr:MAG: hypothetical protein JSW10_04845 [Pseudomonadota bacterium]
MTRVAAAAALYFLLSALVLAADSDGLRLQVADPYIELHSGPGYSYPVYDVIERGDWIVIQRGRAGWLKIQGANNKIGWVEKSQLDNTLEAAGIEAGRREKFLEKYLTARFRFSGGVGFINGRLSSAEPTVTIRGGYRATPNLSVELAFTNAAGVYSSSPLIQANVLLEMLAERRVRPFFLLGYSRFVNVPDNLVDDTTSDLDMINAGIGVQFFLSERLFLRWDLTDYVVVHGNQSQGVEGNANDNFLAATAVELGFYF